MNDTVADAPRAGEDSPLPEWRPRRLTARLRLTLGYAFFAVISGVVALAIIYAVMWSVPNYPFIAANPGDDDYVPSREEIIDVLIRASGYALLLLTVVGLGGGWVLAGQVLRPLQQITRAADRAARGSLDHRVGLTGRRDEFTDLSDTFDHMLDRLQRSFEAQRRFAANASHELRTPLAVSRAMLDVARADPEGQDIPVLLSRLAEMNRRGGEIVDALLQLSALGNAPPPMAPLDLSEAVEEALEAVREEAASQGVTVGAEVRPVAVNGHEVLLRQLVVNLLHNAVRHNVPVGGSLTVTAGPDPESEGFAVIRVANTGAVLDPEVVRTLTEPFLRADGRTTARRGHGLGLAIVAAVAEAHHGGLILAPNPGGGLTVTVRIPHTGD
ncbi:HAMP domain-containing sensor histidine kinase [Streptomyces sp. NPDC020875]|uniref:sensor histidine kinase n=1 Tax=Streptomyces sp. NPDC020875 TaxID=3154898 RepID=UPI0033D4F145